MKQFYVSSIIETEGDIMAQEYICLKKTNEIGSIAINKKVFESIARIEIGEDETQFVPDSSRFKNAVNCKISKDELVLNVDLKVNYQLNVNEICSRLQDKIYHSILHMTGVKMDLIDIKVTGFIF